MTHTTRSIRSFLIAGAITFAAIAPLHAQRLGGGGGGGMASRASISQQTATRTMLRADGSSTSARYRLREQVRSRVRTNSQAGQNGLMNAAGAANGSAKGSPQGGGSANSGD